MVDWHNPVVITPDVHIKLRNRVQYIVFSNIGEKGGISKNKNTTTTTTLTKYRTEFRWQHQKRDVVVIDRAGSPVFLLCTIHYIDPALLLRVIVLVFLFSLFDFGGPAKGCLYTSRRTALFRFIFRSSSAVNLRRWRWRSLNVWWC